ncbi:hypothetical protein C8R43DRAFT_1120555 [Mycena crocata]|nr:hypothetical protein C8R43DRAFT_1120555 [Mycena crocata]
MPTYNPADIPVDRFYSENAKNPLPTSFSGAIGVSYNGYPAYPQNGYNFATAAQPAYRSPQPPNYPHTSPHRVQHTSYDPSYSPSRFVQPTIHSQSYGFPNAPQSTVPSYSTPSPLARRNSVVDNAPRPRPPVSDYSSLAGALDGSVGPTRVRSNSIHKHAQLSPYKPTGRRLSFGVEPEPMRSSRSSKPRRGSKHIGPVLPDGPSDHVRVPQDAYEEPVTELGYQKIDHHRIQPIMFKRKQSSTPGIRLIDIDGESFPGLEGAMDKVFEGHLVFREVKLRVLWPGYPPFEKRFRTQEGTRSLLLMMVASAVSHSMEGIVTKVLPLTRGFEAWTVGPRPNGRNGLWMEDILITGIEHRGGANFQVELWVPKRKMGIP